MVEGLIRLANLVLLQQRQPQTIVSVARSRALLNGVAKVKRGVAIFSIGVKLIRALDVLSRALAGQQAQTSQGAQNGGKSREGSAGPRAAGPMVGKQGRRQIPTIT